MSDNTLHWLHEREGDGTITESVPETPPAVGWVGTFEDAPQAKDTDALIVEPDADGSVTVRSTAPVTGTLTVTRDADGNVVVRETV